MKKATKTLQRVFRTFSTNTVTSVTSSEIEAQLVEGAELLAEATKKNAVDILEVTSQDGCVSDSDIDLELDVESVAAARVVPKKKTSSKWNFGTVFRTKPLSPQYCIDDSTSTSSEVPSPHVALRQSSRHRKRLSLDVVAEVCAKRNTKTVRPATVHVSSSEDYEPLERFRMKNKLSVPMNNGINADSSAPVDEDSMVRLRSRPRRYFPSFKQTFGSGSRRTATVAKWSTVYYHRGIAELFAQQANKGVYTRCGVSGMGIKEVFDIEHGIWLKCVDMMNTLPYVHAHGTIWGKRSNSLNLSAQKTYGLPNPFFIPASKLNANISVMKKLISTHRRSMTASPEGKKWQIFLICTLVRDMEAVEESLLHTMAFVVDCSVEKTEYYLYDPMERSNPYKMPVFVREFKGLSYFDRLHMIFGTQTKEMDCFHRTIDWIAEFMDGAVNFGGKFEYVELHNYNDAWHNLCSN